MAWHGMAWLLFVVVALMVDNVGSRYVDKECMHSGNIPSTSTNYTTYRCSKYIPRHTREINASISGLGSPSTNGLSSRSVCMCKDKTNEKTKNHAAGCSCMVDECMVPFRSVPSCFGTYYLCRKPPQEEGTSNSSTTLLFCSTTHIHSYMYVCMYCTYL